MNTCTPTMATYGARALREWDGSLDKHAARFVWRSMEAQRLREETEARLEATTRRAAANSPWNTPPREERPGDWPSPRLAAYPPKDAS